MAHSIRPGDVLADRYLLVDLLSESGSGRFWRAHDRTLDRHVSVHVIAADDERAPGLLEAARLSAALHDRRILRVLDLDERDGVCYVVNEWGSGRSIDVLVAHEGAMGGRRAAWVVSEVAESIAAAHDAGVAHGRLVPENVMIDQTGSVRIIGLAVEAALLGLPTGRMATDVTDLAGLLYYLLTAKWPGVSRSGVPAAPLENGRVLRPRQVKAGVQRPLDGLCDQVLNAAGAPGDAHGPGLRSAHGIREALRDFVGDVAEMAAAEASAGLHPTIRLQVPPVPPPGATTRFPADAPPTVPATPPGATTPPDPTAVPGPTAPPDPTATPPPDQAPAAAAAPVAPREAPAESADLPTQAGVPIFDDENDEVSWLTARAEKPPPPPPFEEPPDRPLFAPEPAEGRPARTPRQGAPAVSQEFWPWEAGTGSGVIPATEEPEEDEVPGRSWMRLAAAVAGACLLLIAIVFAFNLGRGRSPLGADPDPAPESTATTPASTSTPITGVSAIDLDPQGDPPEENRELAPLAVDGDPATAWRTVTYEQDLGPTGLKTGVGLRLDLGSSQEVSEVDLTLGGSPSDVSLYLSNDDPPGVAGQTPVATVTADDQERVTLEGPATGRFLTIWFTSLPEAEGGFRGEVAEVVVRG
ncbi:MAG: protein kinase family protein [Nocardioides sp.]